VPAENHNEFDYWIKKFDTFDYLVFTSGNAVKQFVLRLDQIQQHLNFDELTVVAVGEKTALTCFRNHIPVDIVPKSFSSNGIAEELRRSDISGKKFFVPCSSIARDDLSQRLGKMGAEVTRLAIYDTILPDCSETEKTVEAILNRKPDIFIFTSPSTFHNFVKILNLTTPKDYFSRKTVAAIGPTTESAIRAKGVTVQVTPLKNTMAGLIESVLNFYLISDKI
ncbi:MAG: uroporphyrinogen-III synthase, partial [Desulfobacterales bacterium]